MKKQLFLGSIILFTVLANIASAQIPSFMPTDSLVLWLPFNGNANDESGNENNGIVNGATLNTDRYGAENSAYYFRGYNNSHTDHIKVNRSSSLQNIEAFTLQVYFKAVEDTLMHGYSGEKNKTGALVAWEGDAIGTPPGFFVDLKADDTIPSVGYYFTDGCCDAHTYHENHDSLTVQTNYENWNHLVIVANHERYKIYLNGELQLEKEHISDFSILDNLDIYIGIYGSVEGEDPMWYPFNGYLDDVAIWKKALTEEEIKDLYMGNICYEYQIVKELPTYTPTNNLIAWYPFNGNANDESGNNLHGTVEGAALTTDRFGNENSAYEFNGTSSYIWVADTSLLDFTQSFTFSSWFIADSIYDTPGEVRMILSKHRAGIDTDGYVYGLWGNSDNADESWGILNFSASPYYTSETYPKDETGFVYVGRWYNYVITFSKESNSLKYYLDGILVDSLSIDFEVVSNSQNLIIGAQHIMSGDGYKSYFNGKLDDIGIWDRALSEQEIKGLFNGNICYEYISVTDTLIINTGISSYNPITYKNSIKIYPNPAKDHITIENENIENFTGYQIRITNVLGQIVFLSEINQQKFYIDIRDWTGKGLYFVNIINENNVTVETRKIVIQ